MSPRLQIARHLTSLVEAGSAEKLEDAIPAVDRALKEARERQSEALNAKRILEQNVVPNFTQPVIRGRISDLAKLRFGSPNRHDDEFTLTCLEQYRLAARMERTAWTRRSLGAVLRKGGRVERRRLASHAEDMEEMIRRFTLLWNRLNKPSRLSDNLYMLGSALEETRRLAKRE